MLGVSFPPAIADVCGNTSVSFDWNQLFSGCLFNCERLFWNQLFSGCLFNCERLFWNQIFWTFWWDILYWFLKGRLFQLRNDAIDVCFNCETMRCWIFVRGVWKKGLTRFRSVPEKNYFVPIYLYHYQSNWQRITTQQTTFARCRGRELLAAGALRRATKVCGGALRVFERVRGVCEARRCEALRVCVCVCVLTLNPKP